MNILIRALLPTLLVLAWFGHVSGQFADTAVLKAAKPEDRQDVKSVPPPLGARVLFDGKGLNPWIRLDGEAATWKVRGGVLEVGSGNIMTSEEFAGHFLLHLEFRVPYLPDVKPHRRGNSGVYLQGRYQVQILDSYGVQSTQTDCGAIYSLAAPRVNASKLPGVWQSFDIEFWAPRFQRVAIDLPPHLGMGHDIRVWSSELERVAPPYITVLQNGVKIHDAFPIPVDNTPLGLGGAAWNPGPIMLQDQGSPVQFRNIWLLQGGTLARSTEPREE